MKIFLRQKDIKNNKKSLYLDIYEKGKRRFEFLNLYLEPKVINKKDGKIELKYSDKDKQILELANKIRSQREIELAHSVNKFQYEKSKNINFIEYMRKLAISKEGINTRTSFLQSLNYIIENWGDTLSFSEINKNFVKKYIQYLEKNGIHNNSINLYLSKIKTTIKKAIKEKLINENPFNEFERGELPKNLTAKREYLLLSEINLLIKTPIEQENVKNAFLFSCFTGLRISDIIKLKWKDIQNDRIAIRMTKTKEQIYLDLSGPAKQILSKIEPKTEFVFQEIKHNQYVNYYIKKWIKRAGIDKNVSIHTARHSFAVNYLSLGGDIFILKDLLGHSLLETTLIYAEIIDEKKKQAMNLFPKIDLE